MQRNRITVACAHCAAPFETIPSRSRSGRGRFCGLPCRNASYVGPRGPLADRFWPKVRREHPDACHIWTGGTDGRGYGQISVQGRPAKAHRIAWELTYGSIPPGLHIRHRCDNPPCCNPSHLLLGTHPQNMADMVERRRSALGERNGSHTKPERHSSRLHPESRPRGESHPRAKMTAVLIRDLKARRAAGESFGALARDTGVSRATVTRAVKGVSWKHLGQPE
jgi:hypothetical protein